MATKISRFEIDWWIIQKRFIYMVAGVAALLLLIGGAGVYVWIYGNPFKNVGMETKAPAGARFIAFEGDVRVVRAATRETINASSQTQLYPGDTVQTQADGRALISMADGSTLRVRENSTVIIRDNTSTEGEQKINVRIAVDRGQINVRTEDQPDNASNVVETKQTQNKLSSRTNSSFIVNPDNTEEIRVDIGSVETTNKDGEKLNVRAGEYVSVNPAGTLARPERLLDVPQPIGPRDLERVYANGSGSASVSLRWQKPVRGTPAHYRVEVATSPFFVAAGKVIERDQLSATELGVSDLRPGNYFWRVRATATSGQTSDWSDPQKFIIAPKGTGDQVAVSDVSIQYVGGQIYIIRGRAQPGTTVRIQGRETLVPSEGTFQLQITTPEGAREVMIEAQDPQGNRNQYRLQLQAKQKK